MAPFDMAWDTAGNFLYFATSVNNAPNTNIYTRTMTRGRRASGTWGALSGAGANNAVLAPPGMIRVIPDPLSNDVSILAVTMDNNVNGTTFGAGGQLWAIYFNGNTQNGTTPSLLSSYVTNWWQRGVDGSSGTLVYQEGTEQSDPRVANTASRSGNWLTSENQANQVGARARAGAVMKSATTRKEKMLVTLDSNGNLQAQVCTLSGATCIWGTPTLITNQLANYERYRPFDVEYERQSGNAVIFFAVKGDPVPAYVIWNGSSWNPSPVSPGAFPLTVPAQINQPWWIRAKRNTSLTATANNSNEIVVVTLDGAPGATPQLYGYAWEDSGGVTVSSAVQLSPHVTGSNTATANEIPIYEDFDLAWMTASSQCVVVWGDNYGAVYTAGPEQCQPGRAPIGGLGLDQGGLGDAEREQFDQPAAPADLGREQHERDPPGPLGFRPHGGLQQHRRRHLLRDRR